MSSEPNKWKTPTCGQHHSEESDEEVGVFSEGHVGFTTCLLELLELFGFQPVVTIRDGVDEMVRQHEWNSFSADTELLLVMTQEMSKVYMEDLPV